MKRPERIRRVALLCCHCLRNLAVYRAGWHSGRLRVSRQFWINANGNALDIAVLEWCKLFADRQGKHHWRKVVVDSNDFLAGLYATLGISEAEYRRYVLSVLRYRDKFIAHLDDDRIMHIPRTRLLRKSAAYLFDRLRADALNLQYLGDAPPSAEQHYTYMYRHAVDEHAKNTT
jgi:hypothetical protein